MDVVLMIVCIAVLLGLGTWLEDLSNRMED